MEIRQLIAFEKVAELCSFSQAAKALGYSQSAITIQIGQLEKEFNTRLFDRFGRHVSITPAGRQMLRHAKSILDQVDNMKSDFGRPDAHEHNLHIGTLNSLCRFPIERMMNILFQKNPDYHVKITCDSPSRLIEMMERNEIDIIYILDSEMADVRWKKIVNKKEPVVFVCAADSPLAQEKDLQLMQILHEPFFLTERQDNYRYAFDQYLAFQNLEIRPFLEVGDTEMITHMVRDNKGISLLPYFAVREHIESGELARLNVTDYHLNMYHQVFYYKDKWVTDEMLEFIRIVKAALL